MSGGWRTLSTQYDIETGEDQLDLWPRELGHSFSQGSSVDREYLRYIRDGIFGKTRNARREQHVAGCVGPSQVAVSGTQITWQ